MKILMGLFIVCLCFACTAKKEQPVVITNEYLEEQYIVEGDTLPYRILYPDSFNIEKQYPLLIFLHGAGERGDDNVKQLVHGSEIFKEKNTEYGAILLFPQCPKNQYWARTNRDSLNENGERVFYVDLSVEKTKPLSMVESLMDSIVGSGIVDNSRIYVAGLSMGGMGTLELLAIRPNYFAAAASICGAGAMDYVDEIAKTPLWLFHGDADDVVSPQYTYDLRDSLQAKNYAVKTSIYEGVNHNSWDSAFAEPEFFSWIFSHKRTK